MSDLKDNILQKALHEKIRTDDDLKSEAELLGSSIPFSSISEELGLENADPLSANGRLRFIGNLSDASLIAQNDVDNGATYPADQPMRVARLFEQLHFFGADVKAEGWQGQAGDAIGVDDAVETNDIHLSHISTPSDYLLVIHGTRQDTESGINGVYEVTGIVNGSSTDDRIQVASNSGIATGTYYDELRWSLIKPNPTPLLAYPSGEGMGDETTFLTRLPDEWPVVKYPHHTNEPLEVDTKTTDYASNATVTVEGRDSERLKVKLSYSSSAAQNFSAGEYVLLKETASEEGKVFRVQSSSFTDPEETLVLTAVYNVSSRVISDVSSLDTFKKVHKVGDYTSNPTAVPTDGDHSLYGSGTLDWIHQTNVLPPVPDHKDSSCFNVLRDNKSPDDLGFGPVVFPSDSSGNPDLSNPITDFENVKITSSVGEDEQEVVFDYQNGAIQLSHPIEDGLDLNPASYRDSNGQVKLFASFVSYAGSTKPTHSEGLVARSRNENNEGTDAASTKGQSSRIEYVDREDRIEKSPAAQANTWVFKGPERNETGIYHDDTEVRGGTETNYGSADEALSVGFGNGAAGVRRGLDLKFGYDSADTSGGQGYRDRLGSLMYGTLGSSEYPSEQFVFTPNAGELSSFVTDSEGKYTGYSVGDSLAFDSNSRSRFHILNGLRRVVAGFQESDLPITVDSSNDTFRFQINDQTETFTITQASYSTLEGLQTEFRSAISSTFSGTQGEDWDVLIDDSQNTLRFEAEHALTIYNSNGFDTFFPSNYTWVPSGSEQMKLGFSRGNFFSVQDLMRWDGSTGVLNWESGIDTRDIRVDGEASVVDVSDVQQSLRDRNVAEGLDLKYTFTPSRLESSNRTHYNNTTNDDYPFNLSPNEADFDYNGTRYQTELGSEVDFTINDATSSKGDYTIILNGQSFTSTDSSSGSDDSSSIASDLQSKIDSSSDWNATVNTDTVTVTKSDGNAFVFYTEVGDSDGSISITVQSVTTSDFNTPDEIATYVTNLYGHVRNSSGNTLNSGDINGPTTDIELIAEVDLDYDSDGEYYRFVFLGAEDLEVNVGGLLDDLQITTGVTESPADEVLLGQKITEGDVAGKVSHPSSSQDGKSRTDLLDEVQWGSREFHTVSVPFSLSSTDQTIYFDSVDRSLKSAGESTVRNNPDIEFPLYLHNSNSTRITKFVDIRQFEPSVSDVTELTVGEDGKFENLTQALNFLIFMSSQQIKWSNFKITLLESTELDYRSHASDASSGKPLVNGVHLDGRGHQITVKNFVDDTRPVFHVTGNVTFENVAFNLDTSTSLSQVTTLFLLQNDDPEEQVLFKNCTVPNASEFSFFVRTVNSASGSVAQTTIRSCSLNSAVEIQNDGPRVRIEDTHFQSSGVAIRGDGLVRIDGCEFSGLGVASNAIEIDTGNVFIENCDTGNIQISGSTADVHLSDTNLETLAAGGGNEVFVSDCYSSVTSSHSTHTISPNKVHIRNFHAEGPLQNLLALKGTNGTLSGITIDNSGYTTDKAGAVITISPDSNGNTPELKMDDVEVRHNQGIGVLVTVYDAVDITNDLPLTLDGTDSSGSTPSATVNGTVKLVQMSNVRLVQTNGSPDVDETWGIFTLGDTGTTDEVIGHQASDINSDNYEDGQVIGVSKESTNHLYNGVVSRLASGTSAVSTEGSSGTVTNINTANIVTYT